MGTKKIVIVGAGGFAREVEWLIREINKNAPDSSAPYQFMGYVVSDLSKLTPLEQKSVLGDFEWLEKNRTQWNALAMGIGNAGLRCLIASQLDTRFGPVEWPALVHPSVNLDFHSTRIERGALICANVIGTVNLVFEEFCLVNLACTIGHEAIIGAGSVLNPTVNISGGVTIGKGVLIGTGAQVLQYLTVGDGATVGAGGVVTKNVPPQVTVTGIPAKPFPAKPAPEKQLPESP